ESDNQPLSLRRRRRAGTGGHLETIAQSGMAGERLGLIHGGIGVTGLLAREDGELARNLRGLGALIDLRVRHCLMSWQVDDWLAEHFYDPARGPVGGSAWSRRPAANRGFFQPRILSCPAAGCRLALALGRAATRLYHACRFLAEAGMVWPTPEEKSTQQ